MSIVDFWSAIHEGGHVIVAGDDSAFDLASLEQQMIEVDRAWRLDLSGQAPPLVLPVAVWAATRMYRACQFLVYRQIDPAVIARDLVVPPPQAGSAEACYSADLALRVLPDLTMLARGISPDDPLVVGLFEMARQWPLSSVGVPDLGDEAPTAFIDHSCLRRLYVDRIIERQDTSRLGDPRVRVAVRSALGAHRHLAPRIADAIEQLERENQSEERNGTAV